MTDDIVARLRAGSYRYNEETRNTERIITKNERLAADEIARLRGEVERLTTLCNLLEAQTLNYAAERDAALARAEAAERERDWHKSLTQSHDLIADNAAQKTRAEAAEAKVAKLREALTPFVTSDDNNDEGTEDDWDWYPTLKIFDLRRARTALQETETKGE